MKHINQVFILPQQPAPDDNRPRNGFGYCLGFGEAYAAYYAEQDRQAAAASREPLAREPLAREPLAREPLALRPAEDGAGRSASQGEPLARLPAEDGAGDLAGPAPAAPAAPAAPGRIMPQATSAPGFADCAAWRAASTRRYAGGRFKKASLFCGHDPTSMI